MRYALVLRINDRTYPFSYETAAELNLAIAEVVPNGITLRLGRAPGNSMVLGIVDYDPAIVRNFGLVNYTSPYYTTSTNPRWVPAKLVSSQKIVNGVLQEGYFNLDPAIPTKRPLDKDSVVTEWVPAPSNQLLKPDLKKDFFYLPNDPMTRVGVFKFKTPNPKLWKVPAEGETLTYLTEWDFLLNWALPAWADILDENFQVVQPFNTSRNRYTLKLNTTYYVAIRSYSPATNEGETNIAAINFWPYLYNLPSTHRLRWDIDNWSDIVGPPGVGQLVDFTPFMIQRYALSNIVANTIVVRIKPTKNELNRWSGSGWTYTLNNVVDVATGAQVFSRYLAGYTYHQLLAGREYDLYFGIPGSIYEVVYPQWLVGFTKFNFTQVDMITDQPLETRKAATWYDWSNAQGHAQLFPALSEASYKAGYRGVAFGMTIVSWNYEIYLGWDYYPWMISVYELEDVLNFANGGPRPTPVVAAIEGNAYNRWMPINSWKDNANIVVGKQYVVEISTGNVQWGRTTTQIRPVSTQAIPTVSKPTDKINATLAELEKQIRIPIRFDYIKTK